MHGWPKTIGRQVCIFQNNCYPYFFHLYWHNGNQLIYAKIFYDHKSYWMQMVIIHDTTYPWATAFSCITNSCYTWHNMSVGRHILPHHKQLLYMTQHVSGPPHSPASQTVAIHDTTCLWAATFSRITNSCYTWHNMSMGRHILLYHKQLLNMTHVRGPPHSPSSQTVTKHDTTYPHSLISQ